MAAPTNYDQTNEWLAEVGRLTQDLINLLKGGIDVGQSGTLGNLALIDDLSTAPVGNLSVLQQALQVANVAGRGVVGGSGDLMAEGFAGLGSFVNYSDLASLDAAENSYSQFYRLSSSSFSPYGTAGAGIRTQYSGDGRAIDLFIGTTNLGLWRRERPSSGSPWNEPVKLYDRSDAVGTVSQSGGVLTGALIERGSNANGEYTKFADGTLVCSHNLNLGTDGFLVQAGGWFRPDSEVTWDFPSLFISPPSSVQLTIQRPNINVPAFVTLYVGPTTELVRFVPWLSNNNGGTRNVQAFAIGRWY